MLEATLKTDPKCLAKTYTYQVENVTTELSVTATAHGFVNPEFSWSVNAHPVSSLIWFFHENSYTACFGGFGCGIVM